MDLELGKKKASYRIRVTDLETGKSKSISVYRKGTKKPLSELLTKIIEAFRDKE